MSKEAFWIVRTTLDVFEASIIAKRVGANTNTLNRLRKVTKGDYGVFYISTTKLHNSQKKICEFRQPFKFIGSIEPVQIRVATLPKNKKLDYSIHIRLLSSQKAFKISALVNKLDFIVKKDSWGSYIMPAFINIRKGDYESIITQL
jgi:hypothetical protein